MTKYKTFFLLFFSLTIFVNSNAQSKDTINAYVFNDTAGFHTIEDALKIGRIFLSDTNVLIKQFAWIFTGNIQDPTFGLNEGSVFTPDLITDFKKHNNLSGIFSFTQFIVVDKINPNRELFVKLIAYRYNK